MTKCATVKYMKNVALWIALVLALSACISGEPYYPYDVKYEVLTGGCTASVTYEAASGSVQQETVDNEWTYEFNAAPDAFLYISAQNDCDSGGVQVSIYKNAAFLRPAPDYELYKTATSNGAYVIATASGTN